MFATAELCQIPFMGGWPMAFHTYGEHYDVNFAKSAHAIVVLRFSGVLGVMLCVVWQVFVADDPAKARGITDEELQIITSASGRRPRVQVILKAPALSEDSSIPCNFSEPTGCNCSRRQSYGPSPAVPSRTISSLSAQ